MLLAYCVGAVLVSLVAYRKYGGPVWKVLLVYGVPWPVWVVVFAAGWVSVRRRNRGRR